MRMRYSRAMAVALMALCAVLARAQSELDVPYVPTPQVVVDEMLRLAGTRAEDYVVDLGSGDGRILITAARKFGARGHGVELDGTLIAESTENAARAGVADRVQFRGEDLFHADLSSATLVTLYLVPRVNAKLRPRLLALRPGTRIVSHDFDLGDWRPDVKTTVRKNIYFWIVPARVAGRWHTRLALPGGERELTLEFRQHHQDVDGVVHSGDRIAQVWQPALAGERFTFTLVDDRDREDEAGLYIEATVRGDVMEGEMRRGVGAGATRTPWRARRVPS
jgi:SAM-dependent methyltransferase